MFIKRAEHYKDKVRKVKRISTQKVWKRIASPICLRNQLQNIPDTLTSNILWKNRNGLKWSHSSYVNFFFFEFSATHDVLSFFYFIERQRKTFFKKKWIMRTHRHLQPIKTATVIFDSPTEIVSFCEYNFYAHNFFSILLSQIDKWLYCLSSVS